MFNIITDENGKTSSTRVVLMVMVALFVAIVIRDLIWEVSVDNNIYDIISSAIMFCLGGSALRTTASNFNLVGKKEDE